MPQNNKCRICKSPSTTSLQNYTKVKTPYLAFEFIKPYPLDGLKEVLICKNCQFIYNFSNSKEADYIKYYGEYNKHQVRKGKLEDIDISYFNKLILWSKKNGLKFYNKKILDFGSGGKLLKKVFKKYKINSVSNYDINNCNINNKKFDIIIATHVLEHVFDFNKLFIKFNKYLNNGGYLIVATPNLNDYKKYYYGAYNCYDLEHINHFTFNTLSNLLKLNNYKILTKRIGYRLVSESLKYSEIAIIAKKNTLKENKKKIITINKKYLVQKLRLYFIKSNKEFKQCLNFYSNILLHNEILTIYGISSCAGRFISHIGGGLKKISFLGDTDSRLDGKKIRKIKILEFKKFSKMIDYYNNKNITVRIIIKAVRNNNILRFLKNKLSGKKIRFSVI